MDSISILLQCKLEFQVFKHAWGEFPRDLDATCI